jgi:hypothetical protein
MSRSLIAAVRAGDKRGMGAIRTGLVVVGVLASQVIDPPPWPAPPGAPRLRIHVSVPGGTLYVRASEPRRPRGLLTGR